MNNLSKQHSFFLKILSLYPVKNIFGIISISTYPSFNTALNNALTDFFGSNQCRKIAYLTSVDIITRHNEPCISFYCVDGNTDGIKDNISITFGLLVDMSYNELYGQQYIFSNTGIYLRVLGGENWNDWNKLI